VRNLLSGNCPRL